MRRLFLNSMLLVAGISVLALPSDALAWGSGGGGGGAPPAKLTGPPLTPGQKAMRRRGPKRTVKQPGAVFSR